MPIFQVPILLNIRTDDSTARIFTADAHTFCASIFRSREMSLYKYPIRVYYINTPIRYRRRDNERRKL